jgi:hypothetical protein
MIGVTQSNEDIDLGKLREAAGGVVHQSPRGRKGTTSAPGPVILLCLLGEPPAVHPEACFICRLRIGRRWRIAPIDPDEAALIPAELEGATTFLCRRCSRAPALKRLIAPMPAPPEVPAPIIDPFTRLPRPHTPLAARPLGRPTSNS